MEGEVDNCALAVNRSTELADVSWLSNNVTCPLCRLIALASPRHRIQVPQFNVMHQRINNRRRLVKMIRIQPR